MSDPRDRIRMDGKEIRQLMARHPPLKFQKLLTRSLDPYNQALGPLLCSLYAVPTNARSNFKFTTRCFSEKSF